MGKVKISSQFLFKLLLISFLSHSKYLPAI
jgi:hypothetical protein